MHLEHSQSSLNAAHSGWLGLVVPHLVLHGQRRGQVLLPSLLPQGQDLLSAAAQGYLPSGRPRT